MTDSGTASHMTRDIVERAYACVARADIGAFADLLSDDVTVTETPNHPCPGSWHGKAEVLEAIGRVQSTLGMTNIEVRAIAADGDLGLALIDLTFTGADGEPFVMAVAEAWWVKDKKITEIRPFYYDLTELTGRIGRQAQVVG